MRKILLSIFLGLVGFAALFWFCVVVSDADVSKLFKPIKGGTKLSEQENQYFDPYLEYGYDTEKNNNTDDLEC